MMDIVAGFRSAIQELLVPELKAIRVELKQHSARFESMDRRLDSIDRRLDSMDQRFEGMDRRFEANEEDHKAMLQALGTMSGKLDTLLSVVADYREVAVLKTRLEAVEQQVADLRARGDGP